MSLEALVNRPPRRRVFVSYHHASDRQYYEEFMRMFDLSYEICTDNSVRSEIRSQDTEYVIRAIRERYITGSSCTVVLCGAQTPWRKFVDWEIKATLDAEHALLGVLLPTCSTNLLGQYPVPARLHDNIESGYAGLERWPSILGSGPGTVSGWIEAAIGKPRASIRNGRQLMARNGSPYTMRRPLDSMF